MTRKYCNDFSEQDIAISIARKLGNCVIEDSVTIRTTHLLIGRPRRTLNLLLGLVQGCWILTLEWVNTRLFGPIGRKPLVLSVFLFPLGGIRLFFQLSNNFHKDLNPLFTRETALATKFEQIKYFFDQFYQLLLEICKNFKKSRHFFAFFRLIRKNFEVRTEIIQIFCQFQKFFYD